MSINISYSTGKMGEQATTTEEKLVPVHPFAAGSWRAACLNTAASFEP